MRQPCPTMLPGPRIDPLFMIVSVRLNKGDMHTTSKKAILALSNGEVFHGIAASIEGTVTAEIVFNTAMTGYQEVISDPSHAGQIVTFTAPHIGIVGCNNEDNESRQVLVKGCVMRHLSAISSNYRALEDLACYLKRHNIFAITEVDTRHLTHMIREYGCLNACMTTELTAEEAILEAKNFSGMAGTDLASAASCKTRRHYAVDQARCHVAVLDFGIKEGIIESLRAQGAECTLFPYDQDMATLAEFDGVVLSNGPGDPCANKQHQAIAQAVLKLNKPTLGICYGHQLLALALGGKTFKMKTGHHGINHPVYDREKEVIAVTTQNHNFAVDPESLPDEVKITHHSLFDGTVQGIKHTSQPVLGFQGHPEASPGPHDASSLFQQFLSLIPTE